MAECHDELHPMYAPNCPGCNPEGYQELLSQAPQGQPSQPDPQPVQPERHSTPGMHGDGYGDVY